MRALTEEEQKDFDKFVGSTNGKPNYRIVPAVDCFTIIDGEKVYKYIDRDAPGDEMRPVPFYVLEKFQPPEFFGRPEDWNDDLGAYPSGGDYIYRAYLANEDGGFLPISDALFELVALCVEMDRTFGTLSKQKQLEIVASYFADKKQKREQTEQEKMDLLNEESLSSQHKEGLQPVTVFPSKIKPLNLILPTQKEIKEYAK
jgi:hypothetical protein